MKAKRVYHKSLYGHNVFVKKPHSQSFAAYIKYKRWLANLEYRSQIDHWMVFRHDYLTKHKTGEFLTCFYCDRANLLIYTQESARLATIDHLMPLSQGGLRYDETNLVVACERCNYQKQAKTFEEYAKNINKWYQLLPKLEQRNRSLLEKDLSMFDRFLNYWKRFFNLSLTNL